MGVIVDDLMNRGLVRTNGTEASRGGRPSEMIEIDPNAAVAVGAGMSDYTWCLVATNLNAEILTRSTRVMVDHSPEAAVEAIAEAYGAVCEELGERYILPVIGIGSPGLVDTRSGKIIQAADLGWWDISLGSMVLERLGIEPIVVNRSKVGALAEYWCTRDEGVVQDLVYVSLGTGVAAGIIQGGELLLGANSSAGELGHVTVVPHGPICGCGNRGCLQTVVNEDTIVDRARALNGLFNDAPGVLRAADADDPVARRVVEETAEYLSIALGGLVNLFNPEQIVLGGPVGDSGKLLLSELQNRIGSHAMHHNLSSLTIRRSTFGADSSAIGAAVLVIKRATDFFFA